MWYNHGTDIPSLHTLLVRSKSQATPTFKGISWLPSAWAQVPGVQVILESAHPGGKLENNKLKQGVRLRGGMLMACPEPLNYSPERTSWEAPSPRGTRAVGHPARQDTDDSRWCHTTKIRQSPFHGQYLHLALLRLIASLISQRDLWLQTQVFCRPRYLPIT